MKKLFALLLCLLTALVSLFALAEDAPAEAPPRAAVSEEVERAIGLAATALEQPLDDVPLLTSDSEALERLCLSEPFLYVAPTASDKDAVYIPDQGASAYKAAGLPADAEIRADDVRVTSADVPAGARAVFPLLYCAGYCGGTCYSRVGYVYDHAYSVLLIDREDGSVLGRMNGNRRDSGPMMIEPGDYRRDMNDKNVFWFNKAPRTGLSEFWTDVIGVCRINGSAFIIEEGVLKTALGQVRGSVIVPEGVKEINERGFSGREELTEVRLPDGLVKLGEKAFYGCAGLRSVALPDSVGKLGASAFADCVALESASLPDGLESLLAYTFEGCARLESIVLPSRLKEIGNCCFRDCASLKRIAIPEGVMTIPDCCFSGCASLEDVALPERFYAFNREAFKDCVALRKIVIPKSFTGKISERCFSGCVSLESIELVGYLHNFESYAFENCGKLTGLVLPSRIISVGEGAFSGCDGLTMIRFEGTRRSWSRKWDPNWYAGCRAETTWMPESKAPLILGVAGAVVALAVIAILLKKKKGNAGKAA